MYRIVFHLENEQMATIFYALAAIFFPIFIEVIQQLQLKHTKQAKYTKIGIETNNLSNPNDSQSTYYNVVEFHH